MNLYVGSIPFKWKEKDLLEIFSQYGEVVDVKVVIDNITRQNKGFGFVTMISNETALRACDALNGSEHLGRSIIVQLSQPKKHEAKRPTQNNRSKQNRSADDDKSVPFWKRKKKS